MSQTDFSIIRGSCRFQRWFNAALLTFCFLIGNGGTSLAQTCTAPPSGLTAWWTADGNLQDVVGGKIAVRNAASFVPGNVGQSFSLNGTTSFVQVNNANFLDPGTGSFSVEAWIKTSSLQSQAIFSKYECGGVACASPAYALFLNSGKLQFWVRSAIADYRLNGNAFVADGNFHHVAVVRNATAHQMLLYVDGAPDGTLGPTLEGNLADEDGEVDPFVIGAMTVSSSATAKQVPFAGLIDEVSFYMRALTGSEIQSIYLAGSAGKCKPFQLSFSEFPVAPAPSGYPNLPQRLAVGSDGNLWYTEAQPNYGADRLGRITPEGVITEFPAKQAYGITAGPDGALWSTLVGPRLGRMTTAGGFTEYPANAPSGAITTGSDNKLWFFEWGVPHGNGGYGGIDRMTTAGVIDGSFAWTAPNTYSILNRIILGPDGNAWFTEGAFAGVGKITTGGVITQYPVFQTYPTVTKGIATGPDGRLWFTGAPHPGSGQPTVAAITTNGSLTYYVTSTQNTTTEAITAGPDGYLWATGDGNSGRGLVRMNTAGTFSMYHFPDAAGSHGNDIIVGPDLCLWIADDGVSQIIKACLPGSRVTGVSSPNPDGAYLTGANLSIAVTFDSPVFVTGVPRLKLNSGGTALYSSGSGTNTLTFTYAVQAGETALRLDSTAATSFLLTNVSGRAMAIQLNGGSIRDSAGIDALLMLPISPSTGSLGTNKQLSINPLDGIPPVSTAGPSPAANANGWNKSDVTITINAVDNAGGSGVQNIQYTLSGAQTGSQTVAGASSSLTISSEGVTTVTFFATDNAGNQESPQTLTIRLDKTAPTISGIHTPAPNANGWNNTAVTVSISCGETLSGLAAGSPPADISLSADGANQSAGGTCQDLAGNTAAVTVSGINIDTTAPSASAAASPAANANGWNNTDVVVNFAGSDSLSGIDFCTAPATLNVEGAGQSAAGTCTDKAGNVSATAAKIGIQIDKTPPSIAPSRAPASNANGWNNTSVIVSFACTDALSGLAAGSPPANTTVSAEGANQSASGTCQDQAGNVAASTVNGISIDITAPTASASASPAANANGWNNTNVAITFAGSDALSGIANCSGPVSLSVEGAAQSASGSCTDLAGNVSAPATAGGINIDKTAPNIGGTRIPAANPAGWNNTDVTANFTCSDPLSGLAAGSPPAAVTITAEGQNQTVTRSCQDRAGNAASFTIGSIHIDKTPPTVSASSAPQANPAGWNNSDITVSFTGVDGLSGIAVCSAAVVLSSEGLGQLVPGACADRAGNSTSSAAGPFSLDKTKPVISQIWTNPNPVSASSSFTLNATVVDAGSGAISAEYRVDGGSYAPLTLVNPASGQWSAVLPAIGSGAHTVCVRATDKAANPGDAACNQILSGAALEHASIYVADSVTQRILRSSDDGATWNFIGLAPGTGPGHFLAPTAVETNSAGTLIFVADTGNSRVQRSSDGGATWQVILSASQVNHPAGLAYDEANDKLYVADTLNSRVLMASHASNPSNVTFTVFAGTAAGSAIGKVLLPAGLAVDAAGSVYVADTGNNRIQKNSTGTSTGWSVFAGMTLGTAIGKTAGPTGIFVDSSNRVYVADTGNSRVQVNAGGTASGWSVLFASGVAVGSVRLPTGVVLAASGNVFVCDTGNGRVQKKPIQGGPAVVLGGSGQFKAPTGIR